MFLKCPVVSTRVLVVFHFVKAWKNIIFLYKKKSNVLYYISNELLQIFIFILIY